MKKILILGASGNYAASTSSATAETATEPSNLAAGTIGIYGLVNVNTSQTANNNKYCLLTESTNALGKTQDTEFVSGGGEVIDLLIGSPNVSGNRGIMIKGISKVIKQSYSAPVKQVSYIGFNGSTGKLNLPTIVQNDEGILQSIQYDASTADKIREAQSYNTGPLVAAEPAYDILLHIANAVNKAVYKTETAGITSNGTQAAYTGTATAVKFTKGSKTVEFLISGATGWVASTGSINAGDVVGVAHTSMLQVSFTAQALGTGAGRHLIAIGGTVYNVADAGTAAQNATAIATAINAGTQATATISGGGSDVVTITLRDQTKGEKIHVEHSSNDSAWTVTTLSSVVTTGDTLGTRYKAAATVTTAATFELDTEYEGETGIFPEGTSLTLESGVLTSITEYGLKITVDKVADVYGYAVQGPLQYATITYQVAPSQGFGAGSEIVKIEEGLIAYKGQFDSVDRRMKAAPRYANASLNYDVYTIVYTNSTTDSGVDHNKSFQSTLLVCVPRGHAAQASFEHIIKAVSTEASLNF